MYKFNAHISDWYIEHAYADLAYVFTDGKLCLLPIVYERLTNANKLRIAIF